MDSSQALRSKVELFRDVLHSVLSVLVLIPNKGFASSCIGNKCDCVEQISFIDCSRTGLKLIPRTKKRMVNYTVLSLRDNLLLEVNFTVLMEQFPDLKNSGSKEQSDLLRGNQHHWTFESLNQLQDINLQHITG